MLKSCSYLLSERASQSQKQLLSLSDYFFCEGEEVLCLPQVKKKSVPWTVTDIVPLIHAMLPPYIWSCPAVQSLFSVKSAWKECPKSFWVGQTVTTLEMKDIVHYTPLLGEGFSFVLFGEIMPQREPNKLTNSRQKRSRFFFEHIQGDLSVIHANSSLTSQTVNSNIPLWAVFIHY